MIDIRQTRSYANYLRSLGWTVERIDGVNYFIRKFTIFGSILKIQRPKKIDFEIIDKLCRKYGVFQVILEPELTPVFNSAKHHSAGIGSSGYYSASRWPAGVPVSHAYHDLMLSHGYKLSKSPYLPTKTLQIDLTQTKEQIYKHFKKDARYTIRRSKILSESDKAKVAKGPERPKGVEWGSGITIHEYSTPNEIKKWREAWKNSVKFNRYVPGEAQLINLRNNFPAESSLFLASHNITGRIIGGALFTTSSHGLSNYIIYYWQAFTNSEGRSSLSQYSLLWYGILWAKKHGFKIFDFEGIYDPRFPNKSWLGFTHFKRSFGGYEVEYPGCYVKFRWPLR